MSFVFPVPRGLQLQQGVVRHHRKVEEPLGETGGRKVESSLTIDSAGLIDNVRRADREQVSYMFYMAKADALNLLDETE